jgi:phage terminase small subunit
MGKSESVDMINSTKRHAISEFKEPVFTKKQQAFIQHYVYHDLTNTESAHRAGYAGPARAASILLNDPRYAHVQTKIRELQEAQQKKFEITFDKVARDLQMIRDAAVEDGSYGAAVSAELGRAKLAGLMVDKKEIKHGRIDQMDRAEVESRLQQLIDKNQLAPVLAERAGVVVEGELADEAMVDEELEGEEPLDLEDELEDEEFQDGLDQDF